MNGGEPNRAGAPVDGPRPDAAPQPPQDAPCGNPRCADPDCRRPARGTEEAVHLRLAEREAHALERIADALESIRDRLPAPPPPPRADGPNSDGARPPDIFHDRAGIARIQPPWRPPTPPPRAVARREASSATPGPLCPAGHALCKGENGDVYCPTPGCGWP